MTKSLRAFFLPHFGRTFPFSEPLIGGKGEELKPFKRLETDSSFQTRSYCCFVEWLTICSNLDEYALKLHNDEKDTAFSVKTVCY